MAFALDLDDVSDVSEQDEATVARLTDRLRADPGDHAVALELAELLTRLGRDLDLMALVSARLDEGGAEVRDAFLPLRAACLDRLAARARAEGRSGEAELYEAMLASEP